MSTQTREILRDVPLFAGLDAEQLQRLGAAAEPVLLSAGEFLFRAGDPGDALYVVTGGRVEIVLEGTPEVLIRELGAGDALGELALLTGAPRSAGVRARRDSALLRIGHAEFEAAASDPGVALGISRFLATQLQASRGIALGAEVRPAVVGVIPLSPDVAADPVAEALVAELARGRTATRMEDTGDPADRSVVLDRLERGHDHVVLVADGPESGSDWTEFCLRQSDTLVVLGGHGELPPRRPASDDQRWIHLLSTGAPSKQWLDAFPQAKVSPIGPNLSAEHAAQVTARRIAGRSIGVVCAGGGARGMAHIGLLAELEAAGVVIDRIAGASMGAAMAGLYAMGHSTDEMRDIVFENYVEVNPLGDYTLPVYSLLRGRNAATSYRRMFTGHSFESLPRELFVVTCDLLRNELVVHRRGDILYPMAGSAALPGIFSPVAFEDRLLCDGGVMNNLPVDVMAGDDHGPVIGLDVSGAHQATDEKPPRFRRARLRRAAESMRRALTAAEGPVPSIAEIIFQSVVLGSADSVEAAKKHTELTIVPDMPGIGIGDFKLLDEAIEYGRAAARSALESAPASLFPPA